ncbi:pyridoxal 5'-phosphate synthase glutaminase subunit PdxT [bacterium]|nr:pyridoxal 5'-phosphate synthase glutaminase subunit PdxT [bacterium]
MRDSIGILALQGDFAKHQTSLEKIGVPTRLVKTTTELNHCRGLIIPGGESTTITKLIKKADLHLPLQDFAAKNPVLGTCAGAIMMAKEVDDSRVKSLQLIDISIQRNAYGRQLDSFITELPADFLPQPSRFRSVFIRAPKISRIGPAVEILMEHDGHPVMIQQGHFLATSFHPELTDDSRIHEYFVNLTHP